MDDSELKTGKHRFVLNLPSFREPYVTPKDKEELNEQFRQKHEQINPKVTLHRIRKLKRRLLDVALERDQEPSSVALSYVLLDKLFLMGLVSKDNLVLLGAICLYLSIKFNDDTKRTESTPESETSELKLLGETIENHLRVEFKDILQAEFEVFTTLSFSLFVNPTEVQPHYIRLQGTLETGQQE